MTRTIVSMTSYGHRLQETCPKAIKSLFQQDFAPDKVLLYVAEKDLKFVENQFGKMPVEVKVVPDYMSHKKFFGLADNQYDNDFIVIVDDDLQYKCYFWQKLWAKYNEHQQVSNFIVCNRAQTLSERKYAERRFVMKSDIDVGRLVFGSGAGLLIPPKTMRISPEIIKKGYEIAPHCDESYYSAYCIANGITTYCTGKPQPFYPLPLPKQDPNGLWEKYNRFEKDETLLKVLDYFDILAEESVIVSFTSWKERIRFASKVVDLMRNQTKKPQKIFLTLAISEFPNKERELPKDLVDKVGNDFEIRWTERNTFTFKKLLPIFDAKPSDWILLVDDDVDYPTTFIANMLSLTDGGKPITGSWMKTDYRQFGNSLSANGSMTLVKPIHCLPTLKQMSDYALSIQNDIASDPILTYSVMLQGFTFEKSMVDYRRLQAQGDGRYPSPYSGGKEGRQRSEKTHEICQNFIEKTRHN